MRIRGVPEIKERDGRKRLDHDYDEVNKIMKFLNLECNITDLKRLGKFSEERANHRTILVRVQEKQT